VIAFSTFDNFDVNFTRDIESDDPGATCAWFTIFVGTTSREDEDGLERTHYEYVSFPSTLKDPNHLISISSPTPYYPSMLFIA